jgi:hypothetical protein
MLVRKAASPQSGAVRRLTLVTTTTLLAVLVVVLGMCVSAGGVSRPLRYELSDDYLGWVLIQYADPKCPALIGDGLGERIVVGVDGRACTSSPVRTGWHAATYVTRTASGLLELSPSLVTVHSYQLACSREQFFVRRAGQESIPPEPADWGFCGG